MKRRIYLTLERARELCLRNLLRKVFLLGGGKERTRVKVGEFGAGVRWSMEIEGKNARNDEDGIGEGMENDEVECLIAGLIYKVSQFSLFAMFSMSSFNPLFFAIQHPVLISRRTNFQCLRHHLHPFRHSTSYFPIPAPSWVLCYPTSPKRQLTAAGPHKRLYFPRTRHRRAQQKRRRLPRHRRLKKERTLPMLNTSRPSYSISKDKAIPNLQLTDHSHDRDYPSSQTVPVHHRCTLPPRTNAFFVSVAYRTVLCQRTPHHFPRRTASEFPPYFRHRHASHLISCALEQHVPPTVPLYTASDESHDATHAYQAQA